MDCLSALKIRFFFAHLLNSHGSDNVAVRETDFLRCKQLPFPQTVLVDLKLHRRSLKILFTQRCPNPKRAAWHIRAPGHFRVPGHSIARRVGQPRSGIGSGGERQVIMGGYTESAVVFSWRGGQQPGDGRPFAYVLRCEGRASFRHRARVLP